MEPGEFDLVGFSVGIADRDELVTGDHVGAGDVIIGLPSPGLRSNGYSLARHALLETAGRDLDGPAWDGAHHTLAEELLVPSVIYAPAVLALLRHVDVRGIVHVTGGGLAGNLTRILPKHLDAEIDPSTWEEPRIFGEIRRAGDISQDEMRKVFNLGIGMVVVVDQAEAFKAIDLLRTQGQRAVEIGRITKGDHQVRFA
jgi:phosphoribosylformylglycinamidine cyclo-ligase